MCGRYTLTENLFGIKIHFSADLGASFDWKPRFNIAPTQEVPVIVEAGGRRQLVQMRWGLVPSWAKDVKIGNRMINARAESLTEKPAFKEPFRRQRCIVPSDGFYEWRHVGKQKKPLWIHRKEKKLFGLAGLWDEWISPQDGKPLRSFTIITTPANRLVEPIHDRMPAVLHEDHYSSWLDQKTTDPKQLRSLLLPYAESDLSADPVSTSVNSPAYDEPACIETITEEGELRLG